MTRNSNIFFGMIAILITAMPSSVMAQNLQVQGTFIADIGGVMYKVDVASKTQTRLFSGDDLVGHYGPLRRPTFSPDGKRIAFVCENNVPTTREIWIADNNGANRTKLCDYTNNSTASDNVNWCSDGFIYWCEQTNAIYRVNVLLKTKETVWNQPNITGYHTPDLYVEDMTISNNGHYGSSRGSGRVSAFDLVNKQILSYGVGGCSGWMSGGGTRIVHPYTCCVPFPAGANTYLAVAAVESVTVTNPPGGEISPRPVIKFLWSPGQPNGADQNRAEDFRFAKNSDDYVVAHGRENNEALGALIYYIPTAQYASVPLTNWGEVGLWIGTLPAPPTAGPKIALSDTALAFSAAKLKDTVTVTNGGTGTLGTLTVTNTATWLTVASTGTGNAQSLIFTANTAGLTAGTYRTNVAVSGGGADNIATVAATFTVGSALTAPSGATATRDTANRVTVRWTDNSQGETGFAIERSNSGVFAEIGRTAANVASFVDTTIRNAPGTYSYRIRAFDATSYSGYSDTAQAVIATVGAITLSYPKGGETLNGGSTVRINWTATNITAVVIEFSIDGGIQWTRITTAAAVFNTDTVRGKFPWKIPDTLNGSAQIRISDYNHGPAVAISNTFTVVRKTAAGRVAGVRPVMPGIAGIERNAGGLSIRMVLPHGSGDATLSVWSLDGTRLGSAAVHDASGFCMIRLADTRFAGGCIVRLRAGGRSWTALSVPR